MKIKMLSTRRGAADGITVETYEAGQVYELPPTIRGRELGDVFLREGWATEVKPVVAPEPEDAPDMAPQRAQRTRR